MAHEIEITDGRANVLGRETWWHRLNQGLKRLATWADVEELAPALTYTVEKVKLADIVDADEGFYVPDDMYVILREDGKILATVGDKYTEVQALDNYEWGYGMAQAITGRYGEPLMQSAGSIREGRQGFFVFEGDKFNVGDITYEGWLNMLFSHDGSMKNLLVPSNTVTVCANTFTINLGNTAAYGFRHTASVEERMALALEAQQKQAQLQNNFRTVVTKLVTRKLETREFDLFVDSLFPVRDVAAKTENEHMRARDAVRSLYTAPLQDGVEGTGWAFVQSVNSYEQWNAPIRKAKGLGEETTRALRQVDSLVKGQPLTHKAVEMALAGV